MDDYGAGETGPLEAFTRDDARAVGRWAAQRGIGELSFRALGRDNGGCPGTAGSDDCSGVAQAPYEDSRIMLRYAR